MVAVVTVTKATTSRPARVGAKRVARLPQMLCLGQYEAGKLGIKRVRCCHVGIEEEN